MLPLLVTVRILPCCWTKFDAVGSCVMIMFVVLMVSASAGVILGVGVVCEFGVAALMMCWGTLELWSFCICLR